VTVWWGPVASVEAKKSICASGFCEPCCPLQHSAVFCASSRHLESSAARPGHEILLFSPRPSWPLGSLVLRSGKHVIMKSEAVSIRTCAAQKSLDQHSYANLSNHEHVEWCGFVRCVTWRSAGEWYRSLAGANMIPVACGRCAVRDGRCGPVESRMDVRRLIAKPVRLRFVWKDADVPSFHIRQKLTQR